jgi:pimeloyl-ACP methyl ester carboxylesterase
MAIKSIIYDRHTFDISYEIVNPKEQVDVVILHGWGSSKSLMQRYFHLQMGGFRHIYIDLPGFGNSTCNIALTTADYANIVELFMQELNGKKDIIIGHSFGGKVALLLSPKLLVLVASAGIYIEKPFKIRFKILLYKFLKMLGLASFRDKFVASDAQNLSKPMYETFKNVVDEDLSHEFALFEGKALLLWGRDDTATPLSSAKKMLSLIKDSKLEVYDGDHYFFMKHEKDIATKIQESFLETSNINEVG